MGALLGLPRSADAADNLLLSYAMRAISTLGNRQGMTMRPAFWGAIVLLVSGSPAFACGTERWPVKTGTDKDARSVAKPAQATSIAGLMSIVDPESPTQKVCCSLSGRVIHVSRSTAMANSNVDRGAPGDLSAGRGAVSERSEGCRVGTAGAADPKGDTWRATAQASSGHLRDPRLHPACHQAVRQGLGRELIKLLICNARWSLQREGQGRSFRDRE
jgi:hypothetical protein